ncbi:MAG: SUF system NifU family Fe-S cluster assembly protein [Bacilli bacterium]|jgi:nitrogen fixation NifU-like protein|nr:SUF system NifU family Fe-S cluster assembly protein [Bacilli bacterium]
MQELYRQVILDHYKNPRFKGLKGFNQVHLRNPSCGDDITMEAKIEDGVVKEVHHDGSGCSICCASASVLCELMHDKNIEQARDLLADYYHLIRGEKVLQEELLEEAMAFQGISQFPARIKCATIAWKAFEELLGDKDE